MYGLYGERDGKCMGEAQFSVVLSMYVCMGCPCFRQRFRGQGLQGSTSLKEDPSSRLFLLCATSSIITPIFATKTNTLHLNF